MSDFRCVPIDTVMAEAIRSQPKDKFGNVIRRVNSDVKGLPCRHCLSSSASGEIVLLASYDLPRPKGLYWAPSPIFVHDTACRRYDRVNHVPQIVRERLVSLRSYDADQQCIYDLGIVIDGAEAEEPLRRALADTRTRFVNIHTAKPGCLLCSVDKI
jgi:Protein of unknown function (DUF1203)